MSTLPVRPERPQPSALPGEKPRGGSWLTVLLAFMMAVAGLASLMVMPLVGYMPVIVLAVFGFAALHYCTWGWWLSKIIRDEENDQADSK
jgi:hypothetical protein